MRLHARKRRRLRQIEEGLRKDDPGLDALLAGRPPPGRPAPRARAAWVVAAYLVPPALLIAGLVLHATWLVVAGAVAAPLAPVTAWSLIRRRSPAGRRSHLR